MTSKGVQTGILFVVMVMAIMVAANLPYEFAQLDEQGGGVMSQSAPRFLPSPEMPVMAGWPFRYSVYYNEDIQLFGKNENFANGAYRVWSLPKLLANLSLFVLVAAFLFVIVQIRERRIFRSSRPRATRAFFDFAFAASIIAVPALVLGNFYWVRQTHVQTMLSLSEKCSMEESVWVPRAFARHVPSYIRPMFSRLRRIRAYRLPDEELRIVSQVKTLTDFESIDGKFDGELLSRFRDHTHLNSVRLTRHVLDSDDLQRIASLPYLRKLSLNRSGFTDEAFSQLNSCQGITHLDVAETPLTLSTINNPGWSQSVETLYLPRPRSGKADSLKISGWPRLSKIFVSRRQRVSNEQVLELDFRDLPSLQSIRLDRLQKHSLTLINLPVLREIEDAPEMESAMAMSSFSENQWLAGSLWVVSVNLDGLPSLKSLDLHVSDLEKISLGDLSNLQDLALGAYQMSSQQGLRKADADPEVCQAIITMLSEGTGPTSVYFNSLPLGDLDLSSLSQNKRIRSLSISESGISFEQVKSLDQMDELTSLFIAGCSLADDGVAWILDHFPKLKHLNVECGLLKRLDIASQNRLTKFSSPALEEIEHFRILDQPLLEGEFRIANTPELMQILNAPKLKGLAFEQPWQPNFKLSGLRDIEWFAAGGRAFNDEMLDVVLVCPRLERLTVAYPTLSPDALRKVGEIPRMTILSLPGAGVTDEVTASWSRLSTLWEVNLDDNSIGQGTLAWLAGIPSLRTASLNRISFDDETRAALRELRQVTNLSLQDADLDADALRPLLRNDALEFLDLSGVQLSDDMVTELNANRSLKILRVADCGLSDEQSTRLTESDPGRYVIFHRERPTERFLTSSMVADLEDLAPERFAKQLRQLASAAHAAESSGRDADPNQLTEEEDNLLDPDVHVGPHRRQRPFRIVGRNFVKSVVAPDRGRVDVVVFRDVPQDEPEKTVTAKTDLP
ncbi:hypothetical protein Pla22_34750 [Rubripirellula amarantea]|uniref:Leucine Rich repeats (2 copies) n=1 Tax=Rubripirellula amarantea TaxID=2527999 RepID=A0A5C5WLS6_9BACT|nr:hypothetical protein [Rubripirellula amarantea]TWT50732.1 hypothetical protein Pla22_34750 [Rubripirellula amarantea]